MQNTEFKEYSPDYNVLWVTNLFYSSQTLEDLRASGLPFYEGYACDIKGAYLPTYTAIYANTLQDRAAIVKFITNF